MAKKAQWPIEFVMSQEQGVVRAPKDFDWVRKNIPCQAACPAGTDIPGYLDAIAHKDYAAAYRINLRDNVFPAVLGRVCTRPCEPACRHGWEGLGEPVAICFSKRSASDFMQRTEPVVLEPVFPSSGKTIAVVGAGAAGLTVARELALWGHHVTVFEKNDIPGGLMVQGIPPFRLPRDIVAREIEQIRLIGVDIRCGVAVGKVIPFATLREEYDAVIVAAGTHKPFIPDLPGVNAPGIQHGLEFLKKVHQDVPLAVGKHVIVIGGGFTAVDCARTAKRLGAEKVKVLYRRSEAEMYITGHEVKEMKNEGITFEPMTMPLAFLNGAQATERVRVQCCKTRLDAPDESGRRKPVPVPDSVFELEADLVLLGTGQEPETSWLDQACIEDPGVFKAGDFSMGALSLIDAIGDAKKCARKVDAYVMGERRLRDVVVIENAESTGRTRDMDAIPRQVMSLLPLEQRALTDEVELGLNEQQSVEEAKRCYLCHYKFEIDNDLCIYCDRCLKVMPVDNCIVKISGLQYDKSGRITGYTPSRDSRDYNMLFIDQNECIRCGACAEVCPVECISLQKVRLETRSAADLPL
jgi:NADPH-dependent glutamate synthase beta subunit-like oxidoreductase/ferredoxin